MSGAYISHVGQGMLKQSSFCYLPGPSQIASRVQEKSCFIEYRNQENQESKALFFAMDLISDFMRHSRRCIGGKSKGDSAVIPTFAAIKFRNVDCVVMA